jgi:UDP-galactopyranose mutase
MDILCVSHLRWDFVFQRPQHLFSRAARQCRVFYIEEPRFEEGTPRIETTVRENGVRVCVPILRPGGTLAPHYAQARLLEELLATNDVSDYVLWYYTPMAQRFTHQLTPAVVVYDCMDELSAFAGAPPEMAVLEADLFARADVVFTGGRSLYESKRSRHPNVHLFPSSVDVAHFARARRGGDEPVDQQPIPHPRIGYFGVIDERMDYELLAAVAAARPDWHLVLLGPTAKVDPAALPTAPNLHFLGAKRYEELPRYIAGWDVAMLPFALNDATRYISPTKTPEYLSAGKPVVSTPIADVVRPYGEAGLARIAATPQEFVAAIDAALHENAAARIKAADAFLANLSWDDTWTRMRRLVRLAAERIGPSDRDGDAIHV